MNRGLFLRFFNRNPMQRDAAGLQAAVIHYPDGKRFEFTWEGNDECDPVCGSGWVRIKEKNIVEGEFRIHNGDSSTFIARKIVAR